MFYPEITKKWRNSEQRQGESRQTQEASDRKDADLYKQKKNILVVSGEWGEPPGNSANDVGC